MEVMYLIVLLLVVSIALGQSDFEALMELKEGIEKDPNQILDSWNIKALGSDKCVHNWYGITCSNGKIVSIALDDIGLVGNLSFIAIASLNLLQNLTMSNNRFTGSISGIGSMKSLQFLDLSDNMFEGLLPLDMFSLKKLVSLNLGSNKFEGLIPLGLCNLGELKYLDLHSNDFSGDIMKIVSQLGDMLHVDLSSNHFSGSLDLGVANLSFVSSIQYLNVSTNSLVGELFAHDGIPYFDSLETFDASNNKLEGTLPSFRFVVSLRILRLRNNQLSGSLPLGLLQESSMVLSELDLSLNQLQGPIESITSATMRKLNLSWNGLSGTLPVMVGHCANIDFSSNMLSGNLSRIENWGNYVEDIQLSSNLLTGTLPIQTSQFLRLVSLKISNNSLNGTLPPILGTYPELKVIDFSLNNLDGFLLTSFFTSAKLMELNLSRNNFTGPIPLQNVTGNFSLVALDLSFNALTGHLPPQISSFRYLLYLDLSNNRINGSFPDDFPEGLKEFNVSLNNFSGIVPDKLTKFPDSAFHPGNLFLILPNLPVIPEKHPHKHISHLKPATKIILIVGLVGVAFLIVLLWVVIFYLTRLLESKKKSSKEMNIISPKNLEIPEEICSPVSIFSSSTPSPSRNQLSLGHQCVMKVRSPDKLAGELHLFDTSLMFTLQQLSLAPAEVTGRSCHGMLYKVTLESGNILAVKWLKEGTAKGKKDFVREVKKLGNIKHPNLVSLRGYYLGPKEHEKLVISNYIDGDCLALYLQETERRVVSPLSLEQRVRVAMDVAGCLNNLHNEIAIPHGNLKSSNILLENSTMNTLITDYSLHRILTSAGTAEQVINSGSLGYRPPEFGSSSKPCPSLKSDVYAFGVILLELLTGKNAGEITDWLKLLAEENRMNECFDKYIAENSTRVLDEMLRLALKCILPASERPDMKSIFQHLSAIHQPTT